MTTIDIHGFNPQQAQKDAQTAPVIITDGGEPAYIFMRYHKALTTTSHPASGKSLVEAMQHFPYPEVGDIELDIEPRVVEYRNGEKD